MSGIVQSPAIARDGRSSNKNRTGQILKSMKLLDEACSSTQMPPLHNIDEAATPAGKVFRRSDITLDGSIYRLTPDYSFNQTEFTDFDATYNLTQMQTPTKYSPAFDSYAFSTVNNPGLAITGGMYGDFKDKFVHYNSSSEVFQLLESYKEICADYITLLTKIFSQLASEEKRNSIHQTKQLLVNEKHTWELIGALYRDRLTQDKGDANMEVEDSVKYSSEKTAVEDCFKANTQIRQAQIVIDWLEQNACDELATIAQKLQHYTGRASWQNTLYQLKKGAESAGAPNSNLITEMDPDAPTRSRKLLDELDREDEARFLRGIFSCIRAGRIAEAEELCALHGQPWRVAVLEGWRLYHDPNMTSGGADGGCQPIEGNARRGLWKLAAWHCSNNLDYDLNERAMFGALCGNLRSMLDVAQSWEDCMWAYYKTIVDTATEHHLQCSPHISLPWQHVPAPPLPDEYRLQQCTIDNLPEVFEKVANSSDQIIAEDAKSPHHVIQRCVILNDLEALVDHMASWLESDAVGDQHLRFFAHLVLLLQAIGIPLNPSKSSTLLAAYVRFLIEDERNGHLVAVYTASLPPEEQISCYSSFLETITDSSTRRKYVQLAEEAGLDVRAITKNVVERIRSSGEANLFDLIIDAPLPDDSMIDLPLTADDRRKIEAIEWLVFDPSQRAEAMAQCNAVVRYFLASRKHRAAREALQMLPNDSIVVVHREWQAIAGIDAPLPAEMENAEREHLCMNALLLAQAAFSDWFKHFHRKPQPCDPIAKTKKYSNVTMSDMVAEEQRQKAHSDEMERWRQALERLCDDAYHKIYNVLLFPNKGWLIDAREVEESSEKQFRHRQMELLRRLYIPSLCNLLINVLLSTGGRNEQCCKLADVIADEDKQLYKLFSDEEGRRLLLRIQDAMIDSV